MHSFFSHTLRPIVTRISRYLKKEESNIKHWPRRAYRQLFREERLLLKKKPIRKEKKEKKNANSSTGLRSVRRKPKRLINLCGLQILRTRIDDNQHFRKKLTTSFSSALVFLKNSAAERNYHKNLKCKNIFCHGVSQRSELTSTERFFAFISLQRREMIQLGVYVRGNRFTYVS